MDKINIVLRVFFLFFGSLMWVGIWLTGFDVVHWILFLPATFFIIAAITGICPGLIFFKEIFKEKQTQDTD
jgi:uncharacterized membrane protein YuzA (DUF378 family)